MSASPLVQKLAALNRYLSEDFLGGPKVIRQSMFINAQKGGTLFFVGFLIWWFNDHSVAAWTYFALHGTYGIVWVMKHFAFRDPKWETKVTIGGAIMSFALVLGPYWLAPFILISKFFGERSPLSVEVLAFAIALHTLGIVIMTVSDAQKFFTLKVKRGLITDGMFGRIRHPNYLGEMMLYAAYALLAGHWIPWAVLAWVWVQIFHTNIKIKEASMSRYPEWQAYVARSGLLLPRLVR